MLRSRNHHCQIDCSNPNSVLSGLEMKSKDLFYFWVHSFQFRKIMNGFTIIMCKIKIKLELVLLMSNKLFEL